MTPRSLLPPRLPATAPTRPRPAIQAARLTGGPRKLVAVTEVQGMEGDVVVMQDIFRFEPDGIDPEGKAHGRIVSTGVRPQFMDRLDAHGCPVTQELFSPRNLMSDH